MLSRTDLAVEKLENGGISDFGIRREYIKKKTCELTVIRVENETGAKNIGKPIGTYITLEMPAFFDNGGIQSDAENIFCEQLSRLLPKGEKTVLVVGLGNSKITPDALGPATADGVLATRHITRELAEQIGLDGIKSVAVLTTGVLGQTGIETSEIILGTVKKIDPKAVIVVDALAARSVKRLGCTVQFSDTGISPGSGVNNARCEISEKLLGVPVIAIGVPTVVDAATLIEDLTGNVDIGICDAAKMMVTPKEIDMMIDRAAAFISHCVNRVLQPEIEPEILRLLV